MFIKIIKTVTLLAFITVISACGGGGSSSGGNSSSVSGSSTLDCSSVTTDSNSCYLGYLGLDENAKKCCDEWIAQQNR